MREQVLDANGKHLGARVLGHIQDGNLKLANSTGARILFAQMLQNYDCLRKVLEKYKGGTLHLTPIGIDIYYSNDPKINTFTAQFTLAYPGCSAPYWIVIDFVYEKKISRELTKRLITK